MTKKGLSRDCKNGFEIELVTRNLLNICRTFVIKPSHGILQDSYQVRTPTIPLYCQSNLVS